MESSIKKVEITRITENNHSTGYKTVRRGYKLVIETDDILLTEFKIEARIKNIEDIKAALIHVEQNIVYQWFSEYLTEKQKKEVIQKLEGGEYNIKFIRRIIY